MEQPDDLSRNVSVESRLIVIQDHIQACPYLPDTEARMPLRLPIGRLNASMTDALLSLGYRRSGDFVYRTQCPTCEACEPTRVPAAQFRWSDSFRRVLKRGDRDLTVRVDSPTSDDERVALFNRHRGQRGLSRDEQEIDEDGYRSFLVESCCETVEFSFWLNETLAAVSIVDVARGSFSAVYTYFDPTLSRYSLGTYSILKQLQQVVDSGRQYLYLGMYVSQNEHLNYKARFLPQERFRGGLWQTVQ